MNRAPQEKPAYNRWQALPYELLLMTLLTTCSAYPFISALDLSLGILSAAFISLVLLAVLTAMMWNGKVFLISTLAVCVLAGAAAAIILMSSPESSAALLRDDIFAFLDWAMAYLKGFRVENTLFKHILALLFTALIASAVALFTVRRFDALGAVLPGLACYVSLFVIGHNIHMPSLFGFILAGALYAYYSAYQRRQAASDAGAAASPGYFLASAVPAALAVMIAAIALSSLFTIDPDWMKDIRDKLLKKSDTVQQTVVKTSTDTVSPSELGGVPLLDDTVLMEVTSPTPSVYLRGTSRNVYTGHSWEQSDTSPSIFFAASCNFSDTAETFTMSPLSVENQAAAFAHETITVKYKGMRTSVLYLPLKSVSIAGMADGPELSLIGSDIVMIDRGAPSGLSYGVDFYEPQQRAPEFSAMLNGCYEGYYTDNRALMQDRALNMVSEAAEIFAQYTALPEQLPTRVRELAHEITAAGGTDYEKARAIEKYLSSNYSYTLTPGSYDRSGDFVDQFLFESKEGYCTYFATAMAVLLRCVGIPSRYVEGYVLPPAAQDSDLYLVTKRQGHAWTEAYFEGLGWLGFEPTSAYSGGARPTFGPSPSVTPSSVAPMETPDPIDDDPTKPASANTRSAGLALPLVLLAVAVLTALIYAVHWGAGRRMTGLAPRSAVLAAFGQSTDLLARQGVSIKNGEALTAFAQRAEKHTGLTPRLFLRAVETFQLARYSEHEITAEHKAQLLSARDELLKACRKRIGPLMYLYYRWIWG